LVCTIVIRRLSKLIEGKIRNEVQKKKIDKGKEEKHRTGGGVEKNKKKQKTPNHWPMKHGGT